MKDCLLFHCCHRELSVKPGGTVTWHFMSWSGMTFCYKRQVSWSMESQTLQCTVRIYIQSASWNRDQLPDTMYKQYLNFLYKMINHWKYVSFIIFSVWCRYLSMIKQNRKSSRKCWVACKVFILGYIESDHRTCSNHTGLPQGATLCPIYASFLSKRTLSLTNASVCGICNLSYNYDLYDETTINTMLKQSIQVVSD